MANDFVSQKEASFSSLEERFYPEFSSSLSTILDVFKAQMEVCIPAIVIDVDREKNIVKVEYAPNIKLSTGEDIKRGVIEVPILVASGGGFMVNFPISKGDVGWVIAGDRDTTNYREDNSKQYNLFSLETHQYNFGFFVPDVFSAENKTFKLTEDDKGKFVIQTLDGLTKIRMSDDKTIEIFSKYSNSKNTQIVLNAKTGKIGIVCPEKLTIEGDVEITGKLDVTGDVTGESISLAHHTHPCPHGGDTGEPQ